MRYRERGEDPEVDILYDAIEGAIGRISNFMKLLAHVPWALQFTVPLGVVVQREGWGKLEFRLRNLVIVKTSLENQCFY